MIIIKQTYQVQKGKKAFLDSPEKVWRYMKRKIGSSCQEHFVVLCVDNRNAVTHYELVSKGTMNQTMISPRDIFRNAIIHNSNAIICVHNHPSGHPNPSKEDVAATRKLIEGGKILEIQLLDHVIVTSGGFYSMKDGGYI